VSKTIRRLLLEDGTVVFACLLCRYAYTDARYGVVRHHTISAPHPTNPAPAPPPAAPPAAPVVRSSAKPAKPAGIWYPQLPLAPDIAARAHAAGLVFTAHAAERMAERMISPFEVANAYLAPEIVRSDPRNPQGRMYCRGDVVASIAAGHVVTVIDRNADTRRDAPARAQPPLRAPLYPPNMADNTRTPAPALEEEDPMKKHIVHKTRGRVPTRMYPTAKDAIQAAMALLPEGPVAVADLVQAGVSDGHTASATRQAVRMLVATGELVHIDKGQYRKPSAVVVTTASPAPVAVEPEPVAAQDEPASLETGPVPATAAVTPLILARPRTQPTPPELATGYELRAPSTHRPDPLHQAVDQFTTLATRLRHEHPDQWALLMTIPTTVVPATLMNGNTATLELVFEPDGSDLRVFAKWTPQTSP
jgi:hypothetical protein